MTIPAAVKSCDRPRVCEPTLQGNPATAPCAFPGVALPLLLQRVRRGLPPRTLKRVREYIDAHLEDNVSLQSLAGAAGMSVSRFCYAFKQSEGVSPHAYLMRSRVRHAQALLAETDLPLSEIARACGFSDQSHCTRRFRELVGCTPSSYRQSMRKSHAIE